MFAFQVFIVTLTFLANGFLGLVSYLNNPKSWTNRLLALLAVIFAAWTVANFLALSGSDEATRLYWVRMVMVITSPMGVITFIMASIFPNEKITLQKKQLVPALITAGITAVASMTPFVFKELHNAPNNNFSLVPGPGIILFALNHMGLTTLGLLIMYRKYRTAHGIFRTQAQLFLWGNVITLTLITLTNFVAVVFLGTIQYTFVGPTFTLFQIAFITYAVVKSRFLDIRFMVARSIAYLLFILFVGLFYTGSLFFLGTYLLKLPVQSVELYSFSIVLCFIVAVSYQRLTERIEHVTNAVFHHIRYDEQKLYRELGVILSSTFGLKTLTDSILNLILSSMNISYGYFVLVRDSSIIWVKGAGKEQHPEFNEREISQLIAGAKSSASGLLVFEEQPESELKNIMRTQNFSIVIPLIAEHSVIGIVCFGNKLSGEIYSQQDMNVFKVLRSQIAVAIQNSLSYEEIKQFNATLEDKIKKSTEDLTSANTQLKELDRLKDEFVSVASHELRTPMTAIRGSLSTILEGYAGDISPMVREFLVAAYNENDRLIRLVNNLLNISRIESGRFTFAVTPIHMDAIIGEVIQNLIGAAKEKNLTLTYEHVGPETTVSADGDKVREVLINIIGNAIKFTHKGGVSVRTAVDGNMLITSIIDTGSGIASEDKDLLFKKFSQVQGNYAKQAGGTGLGLYISKIIIEGLGGNIWLDSTLGVGSTFHFSLPITPVGGV